MASAQGEACAVSLRERLKLATTTVHERLHRHPGFAAVASGGVALDDYRALLGRLYGFHAPFETSLGEPPQRTRRLESDLAVLGLDEERIRALPLCGFIPPTGTSSRRLGALYVIEGSALGGLVLARGLDGLLGRGATEGRAFFMGEGRGARRAWSTFLHQLSMLDGDPAAEAEAIDAARETFAAFESWLERWRARS